MGIPIILGMLFIYVFFIHAGQSEETQQKEDASAFFEPTAQESEKAGDKLEAYKRDELEKQEEERIRKESDVKGSDFYFDLHNREEEYAAFVCVIAASFTLIRLNWGYFSAREEVSCKPFLVEAEKGQRACVTLPDGTRVWLNSHSRLEYSNSYGEKDRKVKLQGEAFFDVAKDSAREFVVDAGHLSVKVLGTTFNIKAYQEDDICVASLISGSIQTKIGEKSIQLQPDESIVYNKTNQNLHVERGLSERAMMWKNDELAFNGETLEEIAVILDRLYNVSFEFESEEIKSYRFTGVIKNNSLENVIELISLTSPISYKIMNSTIRIKKK